MSKKGQRAGKGVSILLQKKGNAQAHRDMMRQACDTAVREATRHRGRTYRGRRTGSLILPRLLALAPLRKHGTQNAEEMVEMGRMRHEAWCAGVSLPAHEGHFAELPRTDEFEAAELNAHLAKLGTAEGAGK